LNTPKKGHAQTKQTSKSSDQTSSETKQHKNEKKQFDQFIFQDWCKACGICASFCPKQVIKLDKSGNPFINKPDDCIGCRFCELHCPDFAITIKDRKAA